MRVLVVTVGPHCFCEERRVTRDEGHQVSRCICLLIHPPSWFMVSLVAASLYIMFGLSLGNLLNYWITIQLDVLTAFLERRQVGLAFTPKKLKLLLFERQFLAHFLELSGLLVLLDPLKSPVAILAMVSVFGQQGLLIQELCLLVLGRVLVGTMSRRCGVCLHVT